LIVGPEFAEKRGKFFAQVFGRNEGFLCLARKPRDKEGLYEKFFEYPEHLDLALEYIEEFYTRYDLYFCAQLLTERRRTKQYIETVPHLWADLDPCPVKNLRVAPSFVIQTSPGRTQALWRLDESLSAHEAEALSHRIALYHKADGCDQSGWDLTQLLRIPWTYNFKYGAADPPVVQVVSIQQGYYRADDFKVYEPLPGEIVVPNGSVPPTIATGREVLDRNRFRLSDIVVKLFSQEPDESQRERWSGALWALLLQLAEAGLRTEEMFAIAKDAACNKYERDGRPPEALWTDVRKAYAMVAQRTEAILATTPKPSDLLDESFKPSDSFIEHYIAWAKAQTDAAEIYHQAGAFMMLSAALSGMMVLPTTFNPRGMKLNLWFMILADSTISRKSTAINMAIDLLEEVSSDAVVATEATIEGLFGSMATRPGKPSIFLRDEFAGMLDSMQRKDYYAGMIELLTQLYDGRNQTRKLAKASVKITDPLLIMFVGGARSRILELLSAEHIRSGFAPRFLFFSATADPADLRPLGPPTEEIDEIRDQVSEELRQIIIKYQVMESRPLGKSMLPAGQKIWKAELTDDAWQRYNQLNTRLINDAVSSREPDLVGPMFQRLGDSMLKASVLLAACRPENPVNSRIIVEVSDVEHAISYGITWRESSLEVIAGAGSNAYESQLKRALDYINARVSHGSSRSSMMRIFKLNVKEADMLFATLEGRGLVRKIRQDNEWIYFPLGI
jgi:hypothetical protein